MSENSYVTEAAEDLRPSSRRTSGLPRRTVFAGLFITLQTLVLYWVYTTDLGNRTAHLVPDDLCHQMSNGWNYCQGASWLASRPLLVLVTLLLLAVLTEFRKRYRVALSSMEARRASSLWLALSVAGCLLMLAPYGLVAASYFTPTQIGPLPILLGGLLMIGSALFWLVDPIELSRILGWPVFLATLFLLLFPELSQPLSNKFWREDLLQSATFETVQWLIALMTDSAIEVSRADSIIRVGEFAARIGHPCAGLSGIAFSSMAMTGYILFSRQTLYVGRALLAIPFVALMSWAFNAFRIALLLLIGAHWSPELAADGFHSYAGWIAFTLLTGGTILAIDRISWFHKEREAAEHPEVAPFFRDPVSARLLPFAVFLLTSLLVGAFFDPPSLGYPIRVILTGAVLLAFWRCVPNSFSPSLDIVAVGAGVGIAIVWLVVLSGGENVPLNEIAPGLGPAVLLLWVIFRLVGTTILVPVVEELFFRGYLLKRVSEIPILGPTRGAYVGVFVSSILFAIVHDALLLAFVSGVVLAAIALRRGRVFDAVVAHAVANGLIGIWALAMNDWSVI